MLAVLQIPSAERPPGRPAMPPPSPGPNFASLLQRGQATHGVLARPAPLPPPQAELEPRGADRNKHPEAPTEAQRAARAAAAKAGAKPAQQREKVVPAAAQRPAPPADAPAGGASGEDSAVQRIDDATGAVQAADLRTWLASIKLQEPTTADLALQDIAAGAPGLGSGSDEQDAAGTGDDTSAQSATVPAPLGGARPAAQAGALDLSAVAPAEHHTASPDSQSARDTTPTLLSGAAGAVPRGFDAATMAPIALPAPLYSPEFAQVLAAQVSVLARDGVQQAELHLNPAEMGPISVQIEIDGQQARVDFSADAATTRDVIERGLPELAAALREQGLTLSGGGVFQRAPDPERQPGGPSKRVGPAAVAATARPVAWPAATGLIDLYA